LRDFGPSPLQNYTIIIALLGDILLAPAMMALIYKNKNSNKKRRSNEIH